jgi:hypothetical protein
MDGLVSIDMKRDGDNLVIIGTMDDGTTFNITFNTHERRCDEFMEYLCKAGAICLDMPEVAFQGTYNLMKGIAP